MIPPFTDDGVLPPGIHWATWREVAERFGGTDSRERLLEGLKRALIALRDAGCQTAYIDGSFITTKSDPRDFDACWESEGVDLQRLDPTLCDFDAGRRSQKRKYGGELFPASFPVDAAGSVMLDFFQQDKVTTARKGIVAIDLEGLS
ncbi:MAG: DUF6932 family protein [Thermomicrobiales bacterium]